MHTSHSHGHVTVHVPFLDSFARFHAGQQWSSCQAGARRVGGTVGHYHGIPLRSTTLEDATYTGGLAMGEVVGWARGWPLPPN